MITMESEIQQAEVLAELRDLMTPSIIQKLTNALYIPARITEQTEKSPISFLFALKEWEDFNPGLFDEALGYISGYILHIARKLEWLCNPNFQSKKYLPQKSAKTFVEMLSNKITSENWLILAGTTSKVSEKVNLGSKEMIKLCIDNNLITKDLKHFTNLVIAIKENKLANEMRAYSSIFKTMSAVEFKEQIKQELEYRENEDEQDLKFKLQKYIKLQNKDVSVILDQETEPIESVYVPLTVVKVNVEKAKKRIDSGISEIEFLRDMHRKVEYDSIEVVDFDEIVSCSSENQLWCLTGNPGSGKSFLCKHFAYKYGTNSLPNFQYTISIPCRSEEWHQLEEARDEKKKVVDEEFILSWLCLSMSIGTSWSKSLSQHLLKSEGEGLFIILDGADEFTRNVPFMSTLLYKLIQRRVLSLSTILVTARPGTCSDIQYNNNSGVTMEHFQVLGFSPENRDFYFEKRIKTPDKLTAVHEMFIRHDEIKQLSLVPVNASLFCALFNQSESILSETLSHLYTQLFVYLIRRQLSRMGLKEHSKVLHISDFHPAIRECVYEIGHEANQGIYERELISDKNILLKIDGKEFHSERLGLMHIHIKVLGFGVRVKTWIFQHLTIQEYMAALSICGNLWKNQCYIIRYFTASIKCFSMYKMVIRFMYGILRQDAGCITPIICRHVLPTPMSLHGTPMVNQLNYFTNLVEVSDWVEFLQEFLLLCTLIIETNSKSISEHFAFFKLEFPYVFLYLYFHFTVSPNEWHCFLESLEFICEFEIVHIRSDYFSPQQFHSLLAKLTSCSVFYLALLFIGEDFDTIYSYTHILTAHTLPDDTKISIQLQSCDLSCPASSLLFSSTNQFAGSLMLNKSELNQHVLKELTNQFSSLQYLFYSPGQSATEWPHLQQILFERKSILYIIPRVFPSTTASQLKGLYIDDPNGYLKLAPDFLPYLPPLKELCWGTRQDCYQVLPYLKHLDSLKFLFLFSTMATSDKPQRHQLPELISRNSSTLMEVAVINLDNKGIPNWTIFFRTISSCSNLVTLRIYFTRFSSDDISCWYRGVSALNSLANLALVTIPLQESGMLTVCHSLSYHPALRRLLIQDCQLSSDSCKPLMCLIQTLRQLRVLELLKSELSTPKPEPLVRLTEIAEECSVNIDLEDDV